MMSLRLLALALKVYAAHLTHSHGVTFCEFVFTVPLGYVLVWSSGKIPGAIEISPGARFEYSPP